MQKSAKTFIAKTLLIIIVLTVILIPLSKVLMFKEGTDKYKDFYKEKEQFDVLFFGSSRVLDAFQPMELWDEYGIRSYNLAQHAEGLGRNYWQLKNALEHQVPRLVVMDISAYYSLYTIDPSDRDQIGGLHKQIDHIPLSATKLQTINELVPKGSRSEFIFPFILYHSRWNFLSTYDFTSSKYKVNRKGAESRPYYESFEKPIWDSSVVEESFPFENTKIEEIVNLCKEYNTELLFVNIPYCFDSERQGMMNYISNYLEENNISYINYQRDTDFIDYTLDFADPAHLNNGGSIKLTNAFGQYFVENYGVSECSPQTKSDWDEVLLLYRDEKTAIIQNTDNYMLLLALTYADNDYDVKVISNPERLDYTGTHSFFPDMPGVEGYEGYRIEVYAKGETEPLKIWETD